MHSSLVAYLGLVLCFTGDVVATDSGPPSLPAIEKCVEFEAAIQTEEGELDGLSVLEKGWLFSGAIHQSRWYFSTRRGSERPPVVFCDGERIWNASVGAVLIDPIGAQLSLPLASYWLPQLLQVGEDLWGPFDPVHGRMLYQRLGVDPTLSESEPGERTVLYAWTLGATRSEYRYQFRRVGELWFFSQVESLKLVRGPDGGFTPYSRSVTSMDEPIRVGDALYARKLRAQGWGRNPQRPSEPIELARTTVGLLTKVTPFEPASFEAELERLKALPEGTRVIDRSRPAVLSLSLGSRAVDFDGVGYEFATAVAAPPTDSELMDLLRSAKRDVRRDQAAVPLGGARPRAERNPAVRASGAVTSGEVLIEPGRQLDLGVVRFGESPAQVTASFQLRNTGDETRTIKSVQASCGCTKTAVDQKVLAPGATATITTTLTVERAKTYHSSIWVAFEEGAGDTGGAGRVEELQIVAVGVPEKAIRATALKKDPAGDVLTIVLYSTDGKPEGDVGVSKGAESTIASDSGWLPVGGDAKTAKHWIRDIVKKP